MSRVLKTILLSTGIALVVLGVSAINSAYSLLARLDSVPAESPICLPLDLSAPGIYFGDYRRHFDAILDDQLRLLIAGSPSPVTARALLADLYAEITLSDASGRVLATKVVGAKDFREWAPIDKGLVVTVPHGKDRLAEGDYHLSIDVKKPAIAMREHPHCFVAEYQISGLERMPVWIFVPSGVMALLIGMAMLYFGVSGKGARSRAPATAGLSSSANLEPGSTLDS